MFSPRFARPGGLVVAAGDLVCVVDGVQAGEWLVAGAPADAVLVDVELLKIAWLSTRRCSSSQRGYNFCELASSVRHSSMSRARSDRPSLVDASRSVRCWSSRSIACSFCLIRQLGGRRQPRR